MEFHGGPKTRRKRKPADPDWLRFMSDDEKEAERIEHWQSTSLAEAGLPVRTVNTLEGHGIMTVGDLAKKTTTELHRIPNLGDVTVRKCIKLVSELGLPNNLQNHG